MKVEELKRKANDIRKDIIREVYLASSGHPGGSLSAADIFTVLYFDKMNIDPANPADPNRDRFVLSKGHCAPGYYAALAERGFFDREELDHLREFGHILQGHPDCKHIPGVDMSSGSLGQGISSAVGMALSAKLQKRPSRVYTLLGDGELEEGQVWEAAMFAAAKKLGNLTVIVDNNNLQIDGPLSEVNSPYPIDEKFRSFGFDVSVVEDGNDIEALKAALDSAGSEDIPRAIIACTTKGKGVSFMENQAGWHGKAPNEAQMKAALDELEAEGELS